MQCSTTKSEVGNPTWWPPKRKYFRFSVLVAAILDFPLPVQSYNIAYGSIQLGNPENIGFAVETAFLMGCLHGAIVGATIGAIVAITFTRGNYRRDRRRDRRTDSCHSVYTEQLSALRSAKLC